MTDKADKIAGETPPNTGNTMPDAGKHTPGPWVLKEYAGGNNIWIENEAGSCLGGDHYFSISACVTSIADRALIAAAQALTEWKDRA